MTFWWRKISGVDTSCVYLVLMATKREMTSVSAVLWRSRLLFAICCYSSSAHWEVSWTSMVCVWIATDSSRSAGAEIQLKHICGKHRVREEKLALWALGLDLTAFSYSSERVFHYHSLARQSGIWPLSSVVVCHNCINPTVCMQKCPFCTTKQTMCSLIL